MTYVLSLSTHRFRRWVQYIQLMRDIAQMATNGHQVKVTSYDSHTLLVQFL